MDTVFKRAELSEDGRSFTLDPGQTLGGVVAAWNRDHPEAKVTVDDVVYVNGGIPVTRFLAGKRYRFPTAEAMSAHRSAASKEPESSDGGGIVEAVENWLRHRSPGGTLARDIVRTQVNRAARGLGLSDDTSIWPGGIVRRLTDDQEAWLRLAIQAKNGGGGIPASGSFGGVRAGSGKYQDDYLTYVHPGFRYSFFPNTDVDGPWYDPASWGLSDKLRTVAWRDTGVPNSIEYMLGDFGWTTDEDGNVIVRDTYDFNTGEGEKEHGSYSGIRAQAGRYASKGTEPASQKTRFEVNLGRPEDWAAFDPVRFHSFNEPYRKDFPNDFYYNEEPLEKDNSWDTPNYSRINAGLGGAGLAALLFAATYGGGRKAQERRLEEEGIQRGSKEFRRRMSDWRTNRLLMSALGMLSAGAVASTLPSLLKLPE